MKEIKIGLLGLGNIGTGTYKVLEINRDQIEATVGTKVNIVKILEKYIDRERDIDVPREKFVEKPEDIFDDPEIDIVIELLGGIEPAATFIEQALRSGKSLLSVRVVENQCVVLGR